MGYHPPLLFRCFAGTTELTGGALLYLGFATPVGAGLLAIVAGPATVAAKWRNGPWIHDGGYEFLLVLVAIGVSFAFMGAGRLSLDHALGTSVAGITAGIVVAGVALATPLLPRSLPLRPSAGGPASPALPSAEPLRAPRESSRPDSPGPRERAVRSRSTAFPRPPGACSEPAVWRPGHRHDGLI